MEDIITPNETVYVSNLDERVKLPLLKETLRELFGEYGTILEVVAHGNLWARGQAFVVFDNVESATTAIEELNGFDLFEKPMRLAFAKSKSDKVVELVGGSAELESHKQTRLEEKEQRQRERAAAESKSAAAKQASSGSDAVGGSEGPKLMPTGGLKSTAPATGSAQIELAPPNKTLFLQDVPAEFQTSEALAAVFRKYPGLKEIRVPPGRKGLAFVEYENEAQSTLAKDDMTGKSLAEGTRPIRITYQKQ